MRNVCNSHTIILTFTHTWFINWHHVQVGMNSNYANITTIIGLTCAQGDLKCVFFCQISSRAKVLMIPTTKIQPTWLIAKLKNKHFKNMLAFFGYVGERIMPTCF
jgi:hypothetical protein